MYIMTVVRTFCMSGVPLFLILTGYLMVGKEIELSKKSFFRYYFKLSDMLCTYLIITIFHLIYRVYYWKEALTWKGCLANILGFKQYSWYLNMYIGLYVLIPFLNVLWNKLNDKKEQKLLVIVLTLLVTVSSITGILGWWSNLYPVAYYFIGAYLRSNVNLKKLRTLPLVGSYFVAGVVFGIMNICISKGEVNIFLRGMFPMVGFKSTCVYYERYERIAGKSHYTLSKMFNLAFDGITSLSSKPLHIITGLGGIISVCSFAGVIWSILMYILGNFVKIVYYSKNFIIDYIILFVMSLVTSILVEIFWKYIKIFYQRICTGFF